MRIVSIKEEDVVAVLPSLYDILSVGGEGG